MSKENDRVVASGPYILLRRFLFSSELLGCTEALADRPVK